jgi:uroporphyrinogen decarboxylase
MTNRERILAVLNYESYDRLPVVHFGFWNETLDKWAAEGHITKEEAQNWFDSTPADKSIGEKLGFDSNWSNCFNPQVDIYPYFESEVVKVNDDGSRHLRQADGVIVLQKDEAGSIPTEIDHLLKDRKSWEEHYLPRLQFSPERIEKSRVNTGEKFLQFDEGGLDYLKDAGKDTMIGLFCGSLFGRIRNWVGVEEISYLYMDDETLYTEIIDTVGELEFKCAEYALKTGAKFDFGHFWEDICFKNGPLVVPSIFDEKVGPHYKRITELLNSYGINIVSLDCDGMIDALIPTWFNNGVNTMFPIEVGTWDANIKPWREKYGKELRGVGGMNKTVFAFDKAAIDAEIERLKSLVELGGYIPCPDHRIAPDAKWELVQYYCDKMRKTFS